MNDFDIQISLSSDICNIFHSGKIFPFTKEEHMCSNSSIIVFSEDLLFSHSENFVKISRLLSIFANWLENVLYLENHF